ncbi:MAG TPA: serine/threonine-protein kinase [Candidatus Limnocylindrales bacterium]|nr:serine/threonine-protein kinase [Candidatus Limnocylindrales bacterium]
MDDDFTLVFKSVPHELTQDRWRRLEALFHAAAGLSQEQRAGFIERETAGDLDLRVQLEEMLANSGTAAELLERTVSTVALEASGWNNGPGRRVGPYRLVREIGRGGMGVVFEARRDDDEYHKTVALKVAPALHDPAMLGERLRYERQILAGLEHPHIARFLDGGSQDGVPYFAMEYVEGCPITTFCNEHRLGTRARIVLFRQVCAAIHYAHERLVVHRDLKPANILVTAEGVPKLLDFGIAKLLAAAEGEKRSTVGMRLWTPDYTTPEQVRGGAITTRTDVYLLGLILYELLCGEKAQEADFESPIALDHSICEADPPLPGVRAAARGEHALARQLRGDLDTIVAKAIRKEPERRYGSAARLSEDLGRYLEGRPVQARPGSLVYRAWKTARRNRVAVAAGVMVAITATAGVVATAYQERRAERRFQQVRGLANAVLFGVDDRIKNLAGATEAREWTVRNALVYLDNLSKDAGDDQSLLFELASAYLKIGDVQGNPLGPNLGHPEAALESDRKALGIAQRLQAKSQDAAILRLLARAHQRVAALLGVFRHSRQALEESRRALPLADALYKAQPGDPDNAELLSGILNTMGQGEVRAGDVAEASRHWARAYEVAARWAAEHPNIQARSAAARAQRMVVRGRLYTGDLEGAASLAREHIATCEGLAAGQPGNASVRRDLMNSYVEAGYVYSHPSFLTYGDDRAAAAFHEKALAAARELVAEDPRNATAQFDLAITETDLCVAMNSYDPAKAIGYCLEAMAIAERWPTQFATDGILTGLAGSLQGLGRLEEARKTLARAISARRSMVESDPEHFNRRQWLMRSQNQMADLLLEMGDREAALASRREALSAAEAIAAEHPGNLLCRRDLADTYEGMARYYAPSDPQQARGWYQKSLDIWTAWPGFAPTTVVDRSRRERVSAAMAHIH